MNRIIAGNWKMNLTIKDAKQLAKTIEESVSTLKIEKKILLFPPYPFLSTVLDITKNSNILVGAQNMHFESNGAYTGEVSAEMLYDMGVTHVLVGHSERRKYFAENNNILKLKLKKALENKLTPVFCCGEGLKEREESKHIKTVEHQIQEVILSLSEKEISNIFIAYEPVWAIGTGKTATANQAQEMHGFIRKKLSQTFSLEIANQIPILYGGSLNMLNAKELFQQKDINGGLIGGASLDKKQFIPIMEIP